MQLSRGSRISLTFGLIACLGLAAGCTMPGPAPVTKVELSIAVKGEGKIVRNVSLDNTTPLDNTTTWNVGTKLILTADNTSAQWIFDHWEGANTGTNPRTLLTMDDNKTLTAVFKLRPQTLTIKTVGQGTVSPNGGTYSYGDNVTLTATPAAGWQFVHWSDDASGTSPQVQVTMTHDLTATAVFEEMGPQYPLAITVQGSGTVTPDNGTYPAGTVITLTASPGPAWEFSAWQGDVSDNSTTVQVTMNGSKTVTAVFVRQAAPKVKLDTTLGQIVVELDRTKAPITVDNFIQYVLDGFYDGRDGLGKTIFHRVVAPPGTPVVDQGGGLTDNLTQKTVRGPIVNESNNGLSNIAGTIAMARSQASDSATSQFYFNVTDNTYLDYQSPSNPGYAVFGKVISGQSVLNAINAVPTHTDSPTGMQNVPDSPIYINSVEVLPK